MIIAIAAKSAMRHFVLSKESYHHQYADILSRDGNFVTGVAES